MKGDSEGRQGRVTRREVLALAGGALLAACFSERPTENVEEGEGTEVEMTDQLAFSPGVLTVAVGETVTWRNVSSGGIPHTATADPSKASDPSHVQLPEGAEPWDSGTLLPGDTFSRRFDVPGEYHYFCIPHERQGMLGRIVVTS